MMSGFEMGSAERGEPVRPPAVAGSWYPDAEAPLRAAVTSHLAAVSDTDTDTPFRDIVAIIAPHAGLVYSGPVAAHAYQAGSGRRTMWGLTGWRSTRVAHSTPPSARCLWPPGLLTS